MTVQTTTDFWDTIKVDLDDCFSNEWISEPWQFEDVFDVDDMDDAFVRAYQYQLPSEIEPAAEGAPYERVTIDRIGYKDHIAYTFKAEYAITEEAQEDFKIREIKDGVKAISTAIHRTIERRAQRTLWQGFTVLKGIDNKTVFNTSHSLAQPKGTNPSTYSNRSQLSVSPANVKTRRTAMMKARDENGDQIPCRPGLLLCGPDQFFTVEQFLAGDYEPGSADYNKNVGARGLTLKCMDYFSDPDNPYPNCWILMDKKKAKNLFRWRTPIGQKMEHEVSTGNKLYRGRCRAAMGWTHYLGVDGNTGES